MEIWEIIFRGRRWTWANNRQGEGFIEEMIEMFFGSPDWMLEFDKVKVQHLMKQSSDHSMLFVDTFLHQSKQKARFIYDHG